MVLTTGDGHSGRTHGWFTPPYGLVEILQVCTNETLPCCKAAFPKPRGLIALFRASSPTTTTQRHRLPGVEGTSANHRLVSANNRRQGRNRFPPLFACGVYFFIPMCFRKMYYKAYVTKRQENQIICKPSEHYKQLLSSSNKLTRSSRPGYNSKQTMFLSFFLSFWLILCFSRYFSCIEYNE